MKKSQQQMIMDAIKAQVNAKADEIRQMALDKTIGERGVDGTIVIVDMINELRDLIHSGGSRDAMLAKLDRIVLFSAGAASISSWRAMHREMLMLALGFMAGDVELDSVTEIKIPVFQFAVILAVADLVQAATKDGVHEDLSTLMVNATEQLGVSIDSETVMEDVQKVLDNRFGITDPDIASLMESLNAEDFSESDAYIGIGVDTSEDSSNPKELILNHIQRMSKQAK